MSAQQHFNTAPEDRISLKQKSAYAIGMLVNNLQAAALPAMVVILNLGLGMDVLLVGLIGAVPRIFDAISDPLLGYISDNARTRWGRRRPFILAGALMAGLVFATMWQLPSGYIDILGSEPAKAHRTSQSEATETILNEAGGIDLTYAAEDSVMAEIILFGPAEISTVSDEEVVSDLSGFPNLELNAEIPVEVSAYLVLTEAASGEGDGEIYRLLLNSVRPDEGGLYKIELNRMALGREGNQQGNNSLDMNAIAQLTIQITDTVSDGYVTVQSLKLRKSEEFYTRYFWYFMIMSILFFLTYTVYATPFVAFGYEMTPDYHERTRLHAFANTVGQLAWLGVPWFYAIMSSDLFRDTVHGARTLAIAVGILVATMGIIPAIFLRERVNLAPVEKAAKGVWTNLVEFFKGIVITFKCKPFVKLCGATFLVFNGFQLGMSFSIYVMIYYLFGGDDGSAGKLMGWFGMLTSIATLGVIPLTGFIATKIGKRKTFLITISLSLLGYALKWVGYNPEHPYWLLFAAPLVAFGTGSLFTLMGSMISDVCDYDELETHQRREGVFGAIYWWMVKVGMALAGLMTGVLLKTSGFDVALGANQGESTLFWIRIFDVGIPLATSAIALWIIATYTITEQKAHEIRLTLEERRGKSSAVDGTGEENQALMD